MLGAARRGEWPGGRRIARLWQTAMGCSELCSGTWWCRGKQGQGWAAASSRSCCRTGRSGRAAVLPDDDPGSGSTATRFQLRPRPTFAWCGRLLIRGWKRFESRFLLGRCSHCYIAIHVPPRSGMPFKGFAPVIEELVPSWCRLVQFLTPRFVRASENNSRIGGPGQQGDSGVSQVGLAVSVPFQRY